MTETIKGYDKAMRKKETPDRRLWLLSQEQFKLKQEVNRIGNQIYLLKNEKLKVCDEIASLEREKDEIFIKLGLKPILAVRED